MLEPRARRPDHRHHPRRAGPRRPRGRARPGAGGPVPPGRGVVLAVVDPGVGTDRRLVAVEVEHGIFSVPTTACSRRRSPCSAAPQRVGRAHEHRVPAAARPGRRSPGATSSRPPPPTSPRASTSTELGDEVDPAGAGARAGAAARHEEGDGASSARCWWVDRFGNCQLNIDPDELRAHGRRPGRAVEVRFGDRRASRRAGSRTYADAKPSELVLLVDSYGLAVAGPRPCARPPPNARSHRGRPSRWCHPARRCRGATRGRRSDAPRYDDRRCRAALHHPGGGVRPVRSATRPVTSGGSAARIPRPTGPGLPGDFSRPCAPTHSAWYKITQGAKAARSIVSRDWGSGPWDVGARGRRARHGAALVEKPPPARPKHHTHGRGPRSPSWRRREPPASAATVGGAAAAGLAPSAPLDVASVCHGAAVPSGCACPRA